ncbi:hypothetical protein U0070_003313 [Myodes glareolus]|uniref:Uncharacterized protein n=1 Tax=Myodes glareolus TaxID=447135 RepID=A0AAW0JBN2_MYOGA
MVGGGHMSHGVPRDSQDEPSPLPSRGAVPIAGSFIFDAEWFLLQSLQSNFTRQFPSLTYLDLVGKEQFDLSYNPDSVLIEGTIVSGTVKTQRSAVAVCSQILKSTGYPQLGKQFNVF